MQWLVRRRSALLRGCLALATAISTSGAFAGVADLSWTPPTTNTDGSPLTDLAGYRLYWRCGGAEQSRDIDAELTSYQLDGLPDVGTCAFHLGAVNAAGVESQRSNTATKLMGIPELPGAPTSGPIITWAEVERMAITQGTTNATTTTTTSINITVASGVDCLAIRIGSEVPVTGVTVSGQAATLVDSQATGVGDFHSTIYRFLSPTTGAKTVSVSFSGSNPDFAVIAVTQLTGVDQSSPTGTPAKATDTTGTPSISVPSTPGDLVLDALSGWGGAHTVGAGQSQNYARTLSGDWNGQGSSESATGSSTTMSWSNNSDTWALVGVAFKPAAASVGLAPIAMHYRRMFGMN